MKTSHFRSLVLVAAIFVAFSAPVSAAPAAVGEALVHRVSAVGPYVERGTPRVAVVAKLGQPSQRLSDNVWVYRGYRATGDASANPECRTLVVTFSDHEVVELALVNAPAERMIAANVKNGVSPATLIATR